jgi:hypothetical protein
MFGCAARFDLSAPPMNGRRFQAPQAVGQLLPSARTADLPEDGETLDSDDDGLPSVKQILASSKRAKRVIDLTGDDDDDGEGGDGDFTEVSWLRTSNQFPKVTFERPRSLAQRITECVKCTSSPR